MDCRKLAWLGVLASVGLMGCRRQETISNSDPYTPPKISAKAAKNSPYQARPIAVRKKGRKDDATELDAKPANIVQIADVQSQVALDESHLTEQRQKSLKLAKQNYRRAIQLDAKHAPAYLGLAKLCSASGEHDQAMHALDSGLAVLPRDASLWYERGMVLGRQKKFDEALKNLHQAAQLEPDTVRYRRDAGLMLARMGRAEESVGWLTKTMSEPDARYNVARIMRHIGQPDEEKRQLQLALRANPNHQATLGMIDEDREPAAKDEALRLAGHEVTQPAPALRVFIDAPAAPVDVLPQRPAVPAARSSPVIPITADQLDLRPATPEAPKPAKAKPGVQIGFEPNP